MSFDETLPFMSLQRENKSKMTRGDSTDWTLSLLVQKSRCLLCKSAAPKIWSDLILLVLRKFGDLIIPVLIGTYKLFCYGKC